MHPLKVLKLPLSSGGVSGMTERQLRVVVSRERVDSTCDGHEKLVSEISVMGKGRCWFDPALHRRERFSSTYRHFSRCRSGSYMRHRFYDDPCLETVLTRPAAQSRRCSHRPISSHRFGVTARSTLTYSQWSLIRIPILAHSTSEKE